MAIVREGYNKHELGDSSTHHKSIAEQDANRLLEEIMLNKNALEKEYIKIGDLYNHSHKGKQTIIVNNENVSVEKLPIFDSKGFYKSTESVEGMFFTQADEFYNKDEFQKTVIMLENKGFLKPGTEGRILKNFGILALGEYDKKGKMLGVKLTMGFKDESGVVEPFSEIFTTGAGRSTGSKIIKNGVERQATMAYLETTRGKTVVDASAAEMAKAVTFGVQKILTDPNRNPLLYYINDMSYESEFYAFSNNEMFEKYNNFNTATSKNIVRTFSSLLNSDFDDEKFIGQKRAISFDYYKDVFAQTSKKRIDSKIVEGIVNDTKEEKILQASSNLHKNLIGDLTKLETDTVNFLNENLAGFLTKTNLVTAYEEYDSLYEKKVTKIKIADNESKEIINKFAQYVNFKIEHSLKQAVKNKNSPMAIEEGFKNVVNNISLQDLMVEFLVKSNGKVPINSETMRDISKTIYENGAAVGIKKTVSNNPDFPFSIVMDNNIYKTETEKNTKLRNILSNTDMSKSKVANITYALNKNNEMEIELPYVKNENDIYSVKKIKIETNNDVADFKVAKVQKEFELATTIPKEKARLINETTAFKRIYDLSFNNKNIHTNEEVAQKYFNTVTKATDLDMWNYLYNYDDIFKFNPYGSQTGVMEGKMYLGASGSGSNTVGSMNSEARQTHAQGQNVMYTQDVHGKNITDILLNTYEEKTDLSERTLIKGPSFISKEQIKLEEETSNLEGKTMKRNNLNGYGFLVEDDTTWQENGVVSKELKEHSFHANTSSLEVKFNQIKDNFFDLKEIKDMGITKSNIASRFKQSEETANKVISILMTDKFRNKTEKLKSFNTIDENETKKLAENYSKKSHIYLAKKEKAGKAILLQQEYLSKSATIGVKADSGVALKSYTYDDFSFKLILDKVKAVEEGGKYSANGSKFTVSNIYDSIAAKDGNKIYKGILAFNPKNENRKQAGLEMYNIMRTALYNLSENNEANYDNFVNDKVISRILKTFGLKPDKKNKILEEIYYNSSEIGYDKLVESYLDHSMGKTPAQAEFKQGIKHLAEAITGKADTKIDMAEIISVMLNKYEKYSKENNGKFEPILLKNVIMQYEKNGKIFSSNEPKNVYRIVTSVTKNAVTESKTETNAVRLDNVAVRLLREKGQNLFADTVEDLTAKQIVDRESITMQKFLMFNGNHKTTSIDPSDFGNYIESVVDEEKDKIVKINFSKLEETEINNLASNDYMKEESFLKTAVGKVIEEEGLREDETLNKNVVSIIKSDRIQNFVKEIKSYNSEKLNKEFSKTKQTPYQILREKITTIINDTRDETKRKEAILNYLNEYYKYSIFKEFENIYGQKTKGKRYETTRQLGGLFNGDYVGISSINEIAVTKEGTIINNDGVNILKRWARAEKAIKNIDINSIIKNVLSYSSDSTDLSRTMLQSELNKPIEAIRSIFNLADNTLFEGFKKAKGSMSNNMTTLRVKNAFMASPANNDLIFKAFAENVYHPDFEEHLQDFFGEEIAKKINSFERVELKTAPDQLKAIQQTKDNLVNKLKELNDIVITRKEMIHENSMGLKNSFVKTKTGIERTFGKYVGYPLQTVANLSSSLLIMIDNKSNNIFAKSMIEAGFIDNKDAKQLFFLNKKTWFKALRDFDGDKAQYMFNVLKDYEQNKGLIDTLITRDQYEVFLKNDIPVNDEMLVKLNISKSEHMQNILTDKFRERWYDMKLKKELGKHDMYTQKAVSYFLDKAVNENISVSESITQTYNNLSEKYDFIKEEIKNGNKLSEQESEVLTMLQKSKRFKLNRDTPLHSIEHAKATIKTLTGIKDTGKIHSGVTQFRKLAGNIAFNEFDEEFKNRMSEENFQKYMQIKTKIKSNIASFSEVAGMLIEDGAISSKHGQNALVPSLIKTFEDTIKKNIKDKAALYEHAKQSNLIFNMSKSKTIEHFDNLVKDLSSEHKVAIKEISEFLNSSMGAGFDIEKHALEHRQMAAGVLSQVIETGNFIRKANKDLFETGAPARIGKKRETMLYDMDSLNNLFSVTSKASDDDISYLVNELFSGGNERKIFKNNYLVNAMENISKTFEEKARAFDFNRTYAKLEKIAMSGEKNIKTEETAQLVSRLIKANINDKMSEESATKILHFSNAISMENFNPKGIEAINSFLDLIKTEGIVMEGRMPSVTEHTMGVTEKTFALLKKMMK